MTLEAANSATQMAGGLIQAVMGQAFQAQMNLTNKMLRVSMSMSLQTPVSTAGINGVGGHVDILG
jgi:hypothetical protein